MTPPKEIQQTEGVVLTSQEELTDLCAQIERAGIVALDTEFHGEKLFHPKLFLIQIAIPAAQGKMPQLFAVDPITCPDLTELVDVLALPGVETVVHSGTIDLAILYRQYGKIPTKTFDTQVAAGFVGSPYPTGLAKLTQSFLNLRLGKGQTLSDWSRRPLTKKQLEYAFDDVRYLLELRRKLLQELEHRGRTDWFWEEMALRCAPNRLIIAKEVAYKRVTGWGRLDGRRRAVLRELVIMREEFAEKHNRPLQQIMDDKILIGLARSCPKDLKGLAQNRRFHKGMIRQYGQDVLSAIERGQNTPESEHPPAAPPPLTQDQNSVLDFLKPVIRVHCHNSEVAGDLVSPRNLLTRIVRLTTNRVPDEGLQIDGWRGVLLAEVIEGLISGRTALRLNPETNEVETFSIED